MLDVDTLRNAARQHRARVGIGMGERQEVIHTSILRAQEEGYARLTVYRDGKRLCDALANGDIDCAVRGTLPSKDVLEFLKSVSSLKNIMRAAFLSDKKGKISLLAPVGVDEGHTVEEKVEFVECCASLLKRLGETPRVAVLSGGREEDRGRAEPVDRSLSDADEVIRKVRGMFTDVEINHFGILIEECVEGSNCIIAWDGMAGNLIFRTLNYLCKWESYGAPVLNLDKVFIDTSRGKKDYSTAILLGSALCRFHSL